MRKILRGLAAATALSLAPLAAVAVSTAPSANALEAYTTTTVIDMTTTRGEAGDFVSITGKVTASGGYAEGVAYLQRKQPGRAWKNLASDNTPGYAYFPNQDKLVSNAQYRIFFVGGTDGSGNTYASSVSGVRNVKVFRKVDATDLPGRNAKIRFVVKPKFGNKRLVIQTKKGGKFRTTGRLKTNRRGVAVKVFAGSRGGIRYRVIAPGSRDYQTSGIVFTITRRSY